MSVYYYYATVLDRELSADALARGSDLSKHLLEQYLDIL